MFFGTLIAICITTVLLQIPWINYMVSVARPWLICVYHGLAIIIMIFFGTVCPLGYWRRLVCDLYSWVSTILTKELKKSVATVLIKCSRKSNLYSRHKHPYFMHLNWLPIYIYIASTFHHVSHFRVTFILIIPLHFDLVLVIVAHKHCPIPIKAIKQWSVAMVNCCWHSILHLHFAYSD